MARLRNPCPESFTCTLKACDVLYINQTKTLGKVLAFFAVFLASSDLSGGRGAEHMS